MKPIYEKAIEEFLKTDKRKLVAFSEGCIVNWFENNYKKLGFDKIIKKQHNRTPDFIVTKNGKEIKLEIEFLASDFNRHSHKIEEADIILCCRKDVDISGVDIISLEDTFIDYNYEIYPKIDITKRMFTDEDIRKTLLV